MSKDRPTPSHGSPLRLGALLGWVLLLSGCAASALACRPGEPTTDCCIKKFPLSPLESCAASPSDVDRVLRMLATYEAVQMAHETTGDDFTTGRELPDWKQECIEFYVACIDRKWWGPCYDCIRLCEGQHDWPQDKCYPPMKGD